MNRFIIISTRLLIFIILFSFAISINGQTNQKAEQVQINSVEKSDTITIQFDNIYQTTQDKGNGYTILYKLENDTIKYRGQSYLINLPKHFVAKDTAYAFCYFTGWKNPTINNITALIIGNYSSKHPLVYVDYNNNLDFSDDDKPIQFGQDSSIIVYLKNSEYKNAKFPIKLWFDNIGLETQKLLVKHWSSTGRKEDGSFVLDTKYWFATKRMNIKTSNIILNGSKIRIGLYDYDCNGLYNDKGNDRIMIGDSKSNTISPELFKGASVYRDSLQIILDSIVYEVLYIEPTGKFIKLIRSKRYFNAPLTIGSTLPNFEIIRLDGTKTSINQIKENNKYLIIDFWSSWCMGCHQQLSQIKAINKKWQDSVQIIGFNCQDTKSNAIQFLKKNKVSWGNYIGTDEILKKFRISGFPIYVLVDKKGVIIDMTRSIFVISSYFEENINNK